MSEPTSIPNNTGIGGASQDTYEFRNNFECELEALINKHSMENGSNTPDFILAQFMFSCLQSFNLASRRREEWYGKSLSIGGGAQ